MNTLDVFFLFLPQETRRLVIAEMQNIIYGQWLEVLLGQQTMLKMNLTFSLTDQYLPNVNPGIRNSFATAAFRFGHSGLPSHFEMRNVRNNRITVNSLQDHFFNMKLYYINQGQGMEDILNGMLFQGARPIDRFVVQDVTNFLFANVNGLGQDLIARNIQRGRDHGLPGYNTFREFCGLPRACSWRRPPQEIHPQFWDLLHSLYDHPSDIDLFVGGLAERPFAGGIVGRTFNCIIAQQFQNVKFGDRYRFMASLHCVLLLNLGILVHLSREIVRLRNSLSHVYYKVTS